MIKVAALDNPEIVQLLIAEFHLIICKIQTIFLQSPDQFVCIKMKGDSTLSDIRRI